VCVRARVTRRRSRARNDEVVARNVHDYYRANINRFRSASGVGRGSLQKAFRCVEYPPERKVALGARHNAGAEDSCRRKRRHHHPRAGVLRGRHPPLWKVNPINARQIRQNLTYLRRFTPCHVGTCWEHAFSECNQMIDRHLAWQLGACTTCKIPPDRGF
jgi:hypothetical protein